MPSMFICFARTGARDLQKSPGLLESPEAHISAERMEQSDGPEVFNAGFLMMTPNNNILTNVRISFVVTSQHTCPPAILVASFANTLADRIKISISCYLKTKRSLKITMGQTTASCSTFHPFSCYVRSTDISHIYIYSPPENEET